MKCKKAIMGFAALLIVLFHFYIPFSKNAFELFLFRSAYIGVDLFFFVSALSLGSRKEFKTGSFYLNRLTSTYLPFVVLAVIGALYKKWSLVKFIEVIFGVTLFKEGGGSFLWFLPGIMIFYLLTPLIYKLKKKLGLKALPLLLAGWFALVLLLEYAFHYTTIFVLLNRMPIFLIGFFYDCRPKLELKKIFRFLLILLVLLAGGYIVFKFGTTTRLLKPVKDFYYVIAIPYCLAIVELFDLVCSSLPFRLLPLEFVGGFTLELYGLQMIFGYDIEKALFKTAFYKNMPLAQNVKGLPIFLITAVILIVLAFLYHLLRVGVKKLFKLIKEKIKK